jgi:hypothetical protein
MAGYTRVHKYFQENVRDEATFECTDCQGNHREIRTHDREKRWQVDVPGRRIVPDAFTSTTGPTVQLGGTLGNPNNKNNVTCLCPPPAP